MSYLLADFTVFVSPSQTTPAHNRPTASPISARAARAGSSRAPGTAWTTRAAVATGDSALATVSTATSSTVSAALEEEVSLLVGLFVCPLFGIGGGIKSACLLMFLSCVCLSVCPLFGIGGGSTSACLLMFFVVRLLFVCPLFGIGGGGKSVCSFICLFVYCPVTALTATFWTSSVVLVKEVILLVY